MATLVDWLDAGRLEAGRIIRWGCPVPFFGDLTVSRVATVGINPSSREFVDAHGQELREAERRLPTLRSLGLSRWCDVDSRHLRDIIQACRRYFLRNPYDRWFGVLERVLSRTRSSFYGQNPAACHVDLIPYATVDKWGNLSLSQRRSLLLTTGDALGQLLRESPVELFVLNGQSVVRHFELLTQVRLQARPMQDWSLPRRHGPSVPGLGYVGEVDEVGGVQLLRRARVVGYNHNLQSSYGVTAQVVDSISDWIGQQRETDNT